ncbi:MAG: alanine racemase [Proteobacteria bacterium]|nr:alanine racemase [Pseudomonadota bacterium]MBU1639005.1 alanine racemase [Pseudomonadota bacterium]
MNIVRVDREAMRRNYQAIKAHVGREVEVMAVIKADGYGHGMVEMALTLQGAGVRHFGIATVEQGIALRQAGIKGQLVILLGGRAEEISTMQSHSLEPVIFDSDQFAEFSAVAGQLPGRLAVHLKIDCGMGRLGFKPEEAFAWSEKIKASAGLKLVGVMSHFPSADGDLDLTRHQNEIFGRCVETVRASGASIKAHIANSAATLRGKEFCWDMVRPGLALYGCYPSPDPLWQRTPLVPVMSVVSTIVQVEDAPADKGISYGHIDRTRRPSRLAVLPIGYADGFSRSLSAGVGKVLIRGRRAPIIGRVCMNVTVVDVTDIPEACRGDEVIILGRQGNEQISADEIAGWMGTISYEVLCLLGNNMKRQYIN